MHIQTACYIQIMVLVIWLICHRRGWYYSISHIGGDTACSVIFHGCCVPIIVITTLHQQYLHPIQVHYTIT